jgi:hypothetical protein
VSDKINAILDARADLPSEDSWPVYYNLAPAPGASCAGFPDWRVRSYGAGERTQNRGELYQCRPYPFNAWCGQIGYQPGIDQNWSSAWTRVDVCATGASAPPSTNCDELPTWTAHSYLGGARVQNLGEIYECKGWPQSGWCGQAGYQPGVEAHWPDAWTRVTDCLITPFDSAGDTNLDARDPIPH